MLCLICLFISFGSVSAQKEDALWCNALTWPPACRLDTLTQFVFTGHSDPIAGFPAVRATSAFSFRGRLADLVWMPVSMHSGAIDAFIHRSLTGAVITDSADCKLFEEPYHAVYFTKGGERRIMLYQRRDGMQDVFVATIRRRYAGRDALAYIAALLRWR